MRKTTVAWISIPFFYSQYVTGADIASGLRSRGMYGRIEYGYTQDRASDTSSESFQNSYLQNYTLGMRGSVYSPNLLSYLLEGSLFINDNESTTNDVTTDSNTKNINYRINTDFIRSTKYPFSIYDEKTSNPYSSVQPGSALTYNQSSDRYGINGAVELPYFDLRYSAESSDMQRDENFANETRSNKDYMISVNKSFDSGAFSAVYNDRLRDYLRDDRYFNSNQVWSDHSRDARVNGTWNVDKTLRVGSSLSYLDNSISDMKNLSGNVNVNWHPTNRYIAGVDLTASSINAGGNGTDTLMLGGNSSYQISPEFSTTQNISLFRVSGDYTQQTMGVLMLSENYVKPLENNLVLNASMDFMAKSEQNSVASDFNVTLPDRNSYSYTVTGGASKMIESINARVSANVSYYDLITTLDETTSRLSANMTCSTMIQDNLTYSFSGYYFKEESEYFSSMEESITPRSAQALTVDNMMRYWQNVGYDGRLSIAGGLTYAVLKSDQYKRLTRVFPHIDGSFTYRFFQTLLLDSTVSASQDSVSDLTNYSAYMGLNYTLRKIMMSFGTRYLLQTGGTLEERTQDSVYFKISRTF